MPTGTAIVWEYYLSTPGCGGELQWPGQAVSDAVWVVNDERAVVETIKKT